MKKTQKLKVTIEDLTFETTYEKLPPKLKFLAERLEWEENIGYSVNHLHVTNGAAMCVTMEWVGELPKVKTKIFGYDADEFMAKQYK